MIDTAAWTQAVLAANTPAVASNMMQLAVTGFEVMRTARERRITDALELDRLARCASGAMQWPC